MPEVICIMRKFVYVVSLVDTRHDHLSGRGGEEHVKIKSWKKKTGEADLAAAF